MATQISRGFKDISLSFTKHPITNDILILRNEDAIKRSVINLVRTQIGERFFNNLLGTSIESSMFELTTSDITTVLKEEISTLLNNFEPRIRFRNVSIEIVEDYNELNISIEYDIVGLSVPTQNIEFILQPTRV
jgi:phage baseplate assembly protein W